ncbi:hypothetical protein C0995_009103 [Termitomyces sp. Mi166|nr:hypothetical protein C0995_009103 [Termitomyces sp. Mi166\
MRTATLLCAFASILFAVSAAPVDVSERNLAQASTPEWKRDLVWDSIPAGEDGRTEASKRNLIWDSTSVSEDKRAKAGMPARRLVRKRLLPAINAAPATEAETPAWKRTAEAGAPGWKRSDQGAPGWKRADQGAPGWKRSDQGAPGWKRASTGAPGW